MADIRWDQRILRDIRNANGDQLFKLHQKAAQHFAALNGWRLSRKSFQYTTQLFDHPIFLNEATIGQPYPQQYRQEVGEAHAAEHGLVLHIPPHPKASIHYPDGTLFLVFTKPKHVMQWLPEQVNGIAGDQQP
jgi:hypothetical protein